MLAHHNAEEYLHAYVDAAGIGMDKKGPLFRTTEGTSRKLTTNQIKRRATEAGVDGSIGCHTFRATGITTYLKNGGTLEHAQELACHGSARTTGLYDRRDDEVAWMRMSASLYKGDTVENGLQRDLPQIR